MTRNASPAVLPALLAFGGVAVVVALMARELLGPESPLRMGTTSSPWLDIYATIFVVGVPVLAAVGIILWLLAGRAR